ncbi:NusG domain II-containing protein [Enterococcus faecalis]|uniref:NusG domain II-containing protein n=1 Tax=Enterococcus faecalis TaxID=1351 RepID=UPI001144667F|nr:NusG domain II-containing protein [Enterococcus faecalis]MBD9836294.1 NusG domain II-containing protein [Enterococcus faecalis]MDK0489570.1 NusG domain II-containing protein [Enterococcus faecalis]MDK0511411.1 NusG domain II-containing protein [Enterococcus faecalis]NSW20761.1 NusG domain II-containing protein [Enterococcus faecalis]TQB42984.1 NusG domain II-containing protein [Enterococcus faecalis]
MDKILRLTKPWDYLIIIGVIMASFLPYLLFDTNKNENNRESKDVIAVVKIDGEVVDKFNLSQVSESLEKTYSPQKGKYNIIEVAPGKIRVKEDNSPDKIAVRTGWISRPGEMSICLPHKLIVEILGIEENPLIY